VGETKTYTYSLYVILAALFWGIIGLFVKKLIDLGLTPMEIVAVRVMFSSLFLFIYGLISKRKEMKVALKDMHLFIGTGILSIAFFNWAYFTAIDMISLSVAVILLYTAPAFVMIMSVLFLKEKLSASKVLLLCMTLLGCFLVTGLNSDMLVGGDLIGYLIGLASGFGYALYSIFGKFAVKKYTSYTISFYTFLVATIALVPMTEIWTIFPVIMNIETMLNIIGLSLISTVFAFLLYTKGLQGIESSKASILATVEPLAAMVIGIVIFQEIITGVQLLGGALIFISATLASVDFKAFIKKKTAV